MLHALKYFAGRGGPGFAVPAVCLMACILSAGLDSLAPVDAAVMNRGATPGAGIPGKTLPGGSSERTIVIDERLTSRNIGLFVDYLEDRDGRFTIGDVSSPAFAPRFNKSKEPIPNFGLTNSAYWIRFSLENPLNRAVSCDLMIGYPLLDDIKLYTPDGRGGFQVRKSGDLIPFTKREIKHAGFVFPLKQEPGATTRYLRIKTISAMSIPISVMSREELYHATITDHGMNSMYYGMLIIMLAYNLFIFFSVRGKDYLFYSLFITCFIMTSLALDGYGAQFLWPDMPFLSITSLYYFLECVLYIFFTREFLSTRSVSPLLDKCAIGCIGLGTAGFLLNLFAMSSLPMMLFSIIYTGITIILTFLIIGATLRLKMRQAVYYVASWPFIIAGVIIYILRATAVLPVNMVTMQFFKYSMLIQMLIFSFGLADKINVMKKKLEILNANIVREMSDHIRDKEALKRSEERFRGVIERNFDVIFMMDTEGRITYMSPSMTAMSGFRADEMVGKFFNSYIDDEMVGLGMLIFGDLLKGKEVIGFETSFKKKDGTRLNVEINLSPVKKNDIVTGVQGIARDISERKMAEEALLEEKERLAITLRSIGEGVIATDIKWRIHLMNKSVEDLTGWRQEEVLGKFLAEVLVLVDRKTGVVKDLARTGLIHDAMEGYRSSTILVRRDRSERIVSERVAPIYDRLGKITGYVIVVRDITEEVKFHGELLKIEKLESIGILAGGIAHDFNNILTAIIGNINLAKLTAQDNPRLLEVLDDAEKASLRAQELTHQFLTFSRGGAPVRQIASVEEIIRDSSRFILRGSNVRCNYDFQDGLWPVNVDVGQFSQVVQNLVINADQAMPDGGVLTITTENIIMSQDCGLPVKAGQYVRIMVADTGVGIPFENQTKIFDPYFTTKGSGSGLGLTSTYSIIKRHDGYIFVDSQAGAGTTFFIYLPSSDAAGEVEEKQNRTSPTGSGTILFMDDDEAVNTTAAKILRHLGYTVDIALDGEMAVDLYEHSLQGGKPYDLVILDLTIPGGMGGKKTIEKLLALNAGIRAIVSSGYSNDQIMANYRDYGFSGVIAKPYRIDELARVVDQVMHGRNRR